MKYLTLIKRVLDKNVAGLRKTAEIIGYGSSNNEQYLPSSWM
jgi:uncharacterized protein YkwD